MRDPVVAKPCQRAVWQGDIAIFPAFTMSDVDQHASAIDIGDLQMGPLLQAEPTGVDGGRHTR